MSKGISTGQFPQSVVTERFGAARNTGRLIEVWVSSLVNQQDVLELGRAIRSACVGLDRRGLICSDSRGVMSQSPEVLATWVELLAQAGPRIERSAILIPTGESHAVTQIQTVFARAQHPGRLVCTTILQAVSWLEPVMNEDEKIRLRQFLASR